jgi:hypothetical protein
VGALVAKHSELGSNWLGQSKGDGSQLVRIRSIHPGEQYIRHRTDRPVIDSDSLWLASNVHVALGPGEGDGQRLIKGKDR